MNSTVVSFSPLRWVGEVDGYLELLDQTLLPTETRLLTIRDVEALFEAIRSLRVRGAPAIGIAAVPVTWSLALLATHGFLVRPMVPKDL